LETPCARFRFFFSMLTLRGSPCSLGLSISPSPVIWCFSLFFSFRSSCSSLPVRRSPFCPVRIAQAPPPPFLSFLVDESGVLHICFALPAPLDIDRFFHGFSPLPRRMPHLPAFPPAYLRSRVFCSNLRVPFFSNRVKPRFVCFSFFLRHAFGGKPLDVLFLRGRFAPGSTLPPPVEMAPFFFSCGDPSFVVHVGRGPLRPVELSCIPSLPACLFRSYLFNFGSSASSPYSSFLCSPPFSRLTPRAAKLSRCPFFPRSRS